MNRHRSGTTLSHRRASRKLSIRSQQLISQLYESGETSDSGLDSSGEESVQNSEEITTDTCLFTSTATVKMRALSELDTNINQLRKDILHSCDHLVRAVERRKEELLEELESIRAEKAKTIQPDSDCMASFVKNAMNKRDLNLGGCLRFVVDDDKYEASLISLIEQYGTIDEGRAAASKSSAQGIGLRFAIADEATQFELETRSDRGDLSWVEQDQIDVTIRKENIHQKCVVKNNCNGTYTIFYDLQEPGLYEIHVKVNGYHIPDSPYRCNVFEKHDVNFVDSTQDEWTFQHGEKSALVDKTELQHTSKLYSSDSHTQARAWKVRVTTACPKIKIKFGYSNNAKLIPDLNEEFFCKFDLNDLIGNDCTTAAPRHHTHTERHHHHHHNHNRRKPAHRTGERKQSMYHRSSLTFAVFQDTNEKLIHVAAEGTQHEKTTSFKGDLQNLVPFIGIKHFCKNNNCPRPMLVFS